MTLHHLRNAPQAHLPRPNGLAFLLALLCCCPLTACGEAPAVPKPPHILVLMADDLGWKDVGYHGAEFATPRIDRLAQEGLELEGLYTAPICVPARVAFLTGKHAIRVGLYANIRPSDDFGLPPGEKTLGDHLRAAGYRTALVGKWHLGHARPADHPNARGFDHFYGHRRGYIDYYEHERDGVLDWERNGESLNEPGYSTRLLAKEAIEVLRSHDPVVPLFLFLSFNAPHAPLQVAPGRAPLQGTPEEQRRACFAGMVEELDAAIGKVLDTVDELGWRENTLVLFMSDNGGSELNGALNDPLRDGKFSAYEGGLRVPAAVRWPAGLPTGAVSRQVLTLRDLCPTLLAAAGGAAPGLDGVDLLPALREGVERPREDLFFCARRPYGMVVALKRDRWKLVQTRSKAQGSIVNELFDLSVDPYETTDLAEREPKRLGEMAAAVEPYLQSHPGGPQPLPVIETGR